MPRTESIYPHRHCVICYEMIEDKLVDRRAIRFCSDKCSEEYESRKRTQEKMRKVAWVIVAIFVGVTIFISLVTFLKTFNLV